MQITKADGTVEAFKPEKMRTSLRKAGADEATVAEILSDIEAHLTEGMTTTALYRRAFRLLRKRTKPAAARYSLRRALFGLGPTGFPFEDFLAELFRAEGYTASVRQTISGKCAEHEVDIAAYNKTHSFIAEAKFHRRQGIKSDLQVLLYSYARFLDLKARPSCKNDRCGIDSLMVVTNTKFTHSAVRYAKCNGLPLLSWDYPKGKGLQTRVENFRLYPVTILSELRAAEKRRLVSAGIILCRDIASKPDLLAHHGVPKERRQAVITEARQLCIP